MKPLTEEFLLYVSCIPDDKPLILFLDSLDQLDSADGGRQLDWLPKQLPPSVKIVLSTLPQEQYICFPRCQVRPVMRHNIYTSPSISSIQSTNQMSATFVGLGDVSREQIRLRRASPDDT